MRWGRGGRGVRFPARREGEHFTGGSSQQNALMNGVKKKHSKGSKKKERARERERERGEREGEDRGKAAVTKLYPLSLSLFSRHPPLSILFFDSHALSFFFFRLHFFFGLSMRTICFCTATWVSQEGAGGWVRYRYVRGRGTVVTDLCGVWRESRGRGV